MNSYIFLTAIWTLIVVAAVWYWFDLSTKRNQIDAEKKVTEAQKEGDEIRSGDLDNAVRFSMRRWRSKKK